MPAVWADTLRAPVIAIGNGGRKVEESRNAKARFEEGTMWVNKSRGETESADDQKTSNGGTWMTPCHRSASICNC